MAQLPWITVPVHVLRLFQELIALNVIVPCRRSARRVFSPTLTVFGVLLIQRVRLVSACPSATCKVTAHPKEWTRHMMQTSALRQMLRASHHAITETVTTVFAIAILALKELTVATAAVTIQTPP